MFRIRWLQGCIESIDLPLVGREHVTPAICPLEYCFPGWQVRVQVGYWHTFAYIP